MSSNNMADLARELNESGVYYIRANWSVHIYEDDDRNKWYYENYMGDVSVEVDTLAQLLASTPRLANIFDTAKVFTVEDSAASSRFMPPEPILNAAVVQRALSGSMTGTIRSACGGGYTPISKEEAARVIAAFDTIEMAAKQWAELTGIDLSCVASSTHRNKPRL